MRECKDCKDEAGLINAIHTDLDIETNYCPNCGRRITKLTLKDFPVSKLSVEERQRRFEESMEMLKENKIDARAFINLACIGYERDE